MKHIRQRFHEIWWEEPTGQLEGIMSLALLLRGIWMLMPGWDSIPLPVQGYLIPSDLPEHEWGSILLSLAICQIIASLNRVPAWRGLIATTSSVIMGIALLAYCNAGLAYRAVVPYVITIMVGEMVVAWRSWHDPAVAKGLLERRHNGDQPH